MCADGVGPGGIGHAHRVAHRGQLAVFSGAAIVGVAPDNVVDLFMGLALFIQPALDDLDAVEIAAPGVL